MEKGGAVNYAKKIALSSPKSQAKPPLTAGISNFSIIP